VRKRERGLATIGEKKDEQESIRNEK